MLRRKLGKLPLRWQASRSIISKLAITVAVITGSCANPDGPIVSESPPTRGGEDGALLTLAWSVFPDESTRRVLYDANEILISRCMELQGFSYRPYKFVKGNAEEPPYPDILGFDDIEYASKFGFGFGFGKIESPLDEDAPPAPADIVAYNIAFTGPDDAQKSVDIDGLGSWTFPVEGCVGESLTSLYGDPLAYQVNISVRANLLNATMRAVKADRRFQPLVERYAECMSNNGYLNINSPADAAMLALRPDSSFDDRKQEEVPLAIADARCNATTALRAEGEALAIEYLSEMIESKELVFAELKTQESEGAKRAAALVGSN